MIARIPRRYQVALAVLAVAAAVLGAVLLAGGGGAGTVTGDGRDFGGRRATYGPALADPIPYDGRSPAVAPGRRERVLVELPRPALGELRDVGSMDAAAQRAYVASLADEARALLSALDARGVQTRDVVTYERAWHGFAATVDASDLPGLQSLGVRLRPNRRFYPALSQPVPVGDDPVPRAPSGAPAVALLAGGARGGAASGYDAVGRDRQPIPARGEAGGQPLADVLAALGVAPRVVRVSALRRVSGLAGPEEFARTDELLDGLEHVVDPNADGDTSDHDTVALVGVNAPYAGFAQAPEARAVQGARRLGTLVVAPAGQEGPAAGAFGTLGSPGAAAAAVAVAPLSDPAAVARTRLTVGPVTVKGAAVLAGVPPRGELRASRPVAAVDPARDAAVEGRLAVVRAGANPGAQAAAAAAAGARAVLLAQPRADRPLPAMPAGRVALPVLGVSGAGARAVLALDPGAPVSASGLTAPVRPGRGRLSPFASRGPAFDAAGKPELARAGSVVVGGRLVAGAAVAAARAAADAAKSGETDPRALRRRLVRRAGDAAGGARTLPPAPDVPVGAVRVRRERRATGVDFTVGRFERGDPAAGIGTTLVPARTLELTLWRAGAGRRMVERLTPPGGERGVLPGEYAYTLPARVLADLGPGAYRFRVRASAPRQRKPTVVASRRFDVS